MAVTQLSFAKAWQAVEKVQERLMRAVRALEASGVPFAVVGGNAVAVWVGSVDEGAVRNTKDVDVLLHRDDLEKAAAAMATAGFIREDVHGVTMFVDRDDPMPSRGVHVVFVGEKVRPHYQHPAPEIRGIKRSVDGVPALDLLDLLIMKLQAYRRIDQVHVLDLQRVGLIDGEMANGLPEDLRQRLDEILANPDG